MTTTPTAPPTKETGYVVQPTPDWTFFSTGIGLDQTEDVPELQWPNNIRVYHKMRTDPQIDALIKSIRLPMMRLRWKIKQNGASDEVTEDVSKQLGLPIQGDNSEFVLTGRHRFNHSDHLRMALLAPTVYGHMPFNQVGDIVVSDGADNLNWKLQRLSPRMPQTIQRFLIASNGDLDGIIQSAAGRPGTYRDINTGGQRQRGGGINSQIASRAFGQGVPIPRSELAFYCWDREGGNWSGRSLLRPLFQMWLLKDRMLRIDAIKNERFGIGIPTSTAPPGGDPADYQKMAGAIRATENSGVGLPNGASIGIEGIKGSLPDTLASIKMYDEAMARSFLFMVMSLGQTETGSRALGETFNDLYEQALWGFVEWYETTTTQDVIWDIVDWNYGEDEQAPTLVAEEDEERPLDATDLANLVRAGALLVDAELQDWIRTQHHMPKYTGGDPLPTKPGNQTQDTNTDAPAPAQPTATRGPSRRRQRLAAAARQRERIVVRDERTDVPEQEVSDDEVLSEPESEAVSATAADTGSGAREVHARAQTIDRSTVGHREPTEIEVKAGTDFDKIQKAWKAATETVVSKWKNSIKPKQVDELIKAIEQAIKDEDWASLGAPEIDAIGDDVIMESMVESASASITDAIGEAASQGVTLPPLDAVDLASSLQYRATAVANQMSRALSDSAGRMAIQNYAPGVDTADVTAAVREGLDGLSDSYLNDMLGGAMTGAQNTARLAVFDSGTGKKPDIYASELLDENTCGPCEDNDNHQYDNLNEATSDYPAGGFADCDGGPRCRGTLVAVYPEGA